MAMGIVAATVAVAHGLCFMALTTVSPSAEISTIRIMKVPIKAALPAMGPSSSRAIWPRLRPSRRSEKNRVTMSCTQPPSTAPSTIQSVPGR